MFDYCRIPTNRLTKNRIYVRKIMKEIPSIIEANIDTLYLNTINRKLFLT